MTYLIPVRFRVNLMPSLSRLNLGVIMREDSPSRFRLNIHVCFFKKKKEKVYPRTRDKNAIITFTKKFIHCFKMSKNYSKIFSYFYEKKPIFCLKIFEYFEKLSFHCMVIKKIHFSFTNSKKAKFSKFLLLFQNFASKILCLLFFSKKFKNY